MIPGPFLYLIALCSGKLSWRRGAASIEIAQDGTNKQAPPNFLELKRQKGGRGFKSPTP